MDKVIKNMIAMAKEILPFAYSPYSKFSVACCISTDQGKFYSGVNVENTSYGLSACAEQSAICTMISSGGRQQIKSMVILASSNVLCPPCGACRQKIYEFSGQNTIIHLCDAQNVLKSLTIDELLPLAFRFNPLGN